MNPIKLNGEEEQHVTQSIRNMYKPKLDIRSFMAIWKHCLDGDVADGCCFKGREELEWK